MNPLRGQREKKMKECFVLPGRHPANKSRLPNQYERFCQVSTIVRTLERSSHKKTTFTLCMDKKTNKKNQSLTLPADTDQEQVSSCVTYFFRKLTVAPIPNIQQVSKIFLSSHQTSGSIVSTKGFSSFFFLQSLRVILKNKKIKLTCL